MLQWCRRLRLFVVLVLGVALLQPAFAFRVDPAKAPCAAHASQVGHADPGSAMDRDAADRGAACTASTCARSACGGLCLALPMTAVPAMPRLTGHCTSAATPLGELGEAAAPEVPPPIV